MSIIILERIDDMKRKKMITLTIIAVIFFSSAVICKIKAGDENTLVSLAYLNKRLEEIKALISVSVSGNDNRVNIASSNFKLINIKSGKKLSFEEGAEIVLRSGSAIVIASELGGLSDLSDGKDLKEGAYIKKNHNILIPRNDGRGIEAESDIIILIKGTYNEN